VCVSLLLVGGFALWAATPPSPSIGAGGEGYRAHPLAKDAVLMRNPTQHLQVRFDRSRIELSAGDVRVSLGAAAIDGRALAPGRPSARGNRVSYGGETEWYANGPLGLEQGFTLARGGASAVLSLPLRANVPATLAADRQSVAFGVALRYSGLLVSDARGRRLHSWLALGATIQTDEEKVEINSVV
jgi:hypothetical protein